MFLFVSACTAVVISAGSDSAEDPPGREEATGEAEGGEPEEPVEEDGGEADGGSVGIGEPGTAGLWEVTVVNVGTSPTYEDGFMEEQAQGEFKLVDLTVKNVGTESEYFDESGLTLIDADGNRHEVTSSLFHEDSLFYEQVNPGNQVSGVAAFDVPEGTREAVLEVGSSPAPGRPLEVRLD